MTDDLVVSADWLADNREAVRVVDVRDAWEYDGIGHLPRAVHVPFEAFRASESGQAEAGMLPGADHFADLVGEAGIATGDPVVAYDDTNGVFAARLLVTALLYGHPLERLHLLDGDYSAYSRCHEVSRQAVDPEQATYEARFDPEGPLITIEEVREAVDDPGAVLVDTREDWEFAEGHIPGAVRFDWRAAVDEDTRGVKPPGALLDLFAARGVTPDRRVVLYCNTARRISHTYLVLRHLGFDDVDFYEGSLTEWEREGGELATDEADD
jgi:thiosulfate/3-mercaptopyruvate sulfurtransferase